MERDPVEDFEVGGPGDAAATIRADLDLGGLADDDGFARPKAANSSLPFMGRAETKRSESPGVRK